MFNRNTVFTIITAAFMHLNGIARAVESPLPLHLYPQDQSTKVGQVVTWYLTAAGSEPLQYQWKLNGKEIPGAQTNVLRIGSAKGSDQGVYTCAIKNDAGVTETQAVALKVESENTLTTVQKLNFNKAPSNATAQSTLPTQE